MYRLYQWLQQRFTFSRDDSYVRRGAKIVRTRVTVEEQQRTVLLAMAGDCICPLCGHAISSLAGETILTRPVHPHCPSKDLANQQIDTRLETAAKTKKAVRRLR